MTEDQMIATALEEATAAILRMEQQGVVEPHIGPSAFVMVGLRLMEGATSKANISSWLYKLADEYAEQAVIDNAANA